MSVVVPLAFSACNYNSDRGEIDGAGAQKYPREDSSSEHSSKTAEGTKVDEFQSPDSGAAQVKTPKNE